MTTQITTKSKAAKGSYVESVGRRKTAIARVRVSSASKNSYEINGKSLEAYFAIPRLRSVVASALEYEGATGNFSVSAKVEGSGPSAQAEAIRLGIARAIVKDTPERRSEVKKLGFLKRDSRKKERKHFGLKKARKASQWSKR
jgi:small subunit ribosomal protein S9